VILFTEPAGGFAHPLVRMRTEETMNADNRDIICSVVLWVAIVTVFAIL
jgi:hypothetical protein